MIRRWIQRVWTNLRNRFSNPAAAPEAPRPARAVPDAPNVTFSIATVLANAPEVAEEIARIREEQRRRFVQGHLFTALRPAVEAHAVLVARITEDGAQPAEHLLVVAPNAVNDYAHRRVHTGLRRGR